MHTEPYQVIPGKLNGRRVESRLLEEKIQQAVAQGHSRLLIEAYGQHGIGGRLWHAANRNLHVRIKGPVGQRVGAMGFANTEIDVDGPASDDVGWLNAGAFIVVHGNATNGTANAMAQGRIYVAGSIGARGMTMTKHNPRFAPPELWVLGSVGDYFGEFMAGGIAVVCGHDPQNAGNVLGYRPLVGMVGGKVYFRGPQRGYSQVDARQVSIDDAEWRWLKERLKEYLARILRPELFDQLARREQWQCLKARSPHERFAKAKRSMSEFRTRVWNQTLGKGGLLGDLSYLDRSPVPVITRGELRRFVPVWENHTYKAPCEAGCPTGIPVQQRWRLVREGRVDEAVQLALDFTPFPATICGYLCPNVCMQSCTKQSALMTPVDVTQLGRASIAAGLPVLPPLSGRKVAVVGGGPAGISVAWQLRRKGHDATIYDAAPSLGGKIAAAIPVSRLPQDVFDQELARVRQVLPHVHLQQRLTQDEMARLIVDNDSVVIASGARNARLLPVPGRERLVAALDFLAAAKTGKASVGSKVVIIGAGNVGCDAAAEAARLGAVEITLLDMQAPAAFGKERAAAEKAGARFLWPVTTRAITETGVQLAEGETIPADTVIVSIGDAPDLDFVPAEIDRERGFIKVDADFRTTDPKVFAIGDVVRPGLLTDAIGAGRRAAAAIDALLTGREPAADDRRIIDIRRISLAYYDPRIVHYENIQQCGSQCASCGQCRDCGICAATCPESAIDRIDKGEGEFEYTVDAQRCIGCGFCAGACPCGIWDLVENTPLE
jgi:NADPH-dependent glutamate synthase beta subunit-like oxidoreductase/glutamate synthase domain-containing protein 3/Pyruvate/2-oxoacid:ferredoxin oxidoreductase delta subunit